MVSDEYSFQKSIRDLRPSMMLDCVRGLMEAERRTPAPARSFADWMVQVFGAGIAKHFMGPYNLKVWATPLELMSYQWIAERVAVIDSDAVLRSIRGDEPPTAWGPNDRFRYPLRGGTGALCRNVAEPLLDHVELRTPVDAVDPLARVVHTKGGRRWEYDVLLNTMPLNRLIAKLEHVPDRVRRATTDLTWTGSHIVGIGIDRPAGTDKNWIYFPQPDVPFYRVTYLSNYSPFMTAEPDQTLLLAETSRSPYREWDAHTIVDEVIDGLVRTQLMTPDDRALIVSRWLYSPAMTYPVPTIGRDAALGTIQPWLRSHDIWSRGRFGAWLYEIGNMDHSFMQGVEWVNLVLYGEPEHTWTDSTSADNATPDRAP